LDEQMIREMENTQNTIWSPMILNGTGFGEYLSNIPVRIDGAAGPTRLAVVSKGPFSKLRNGSITTGTARSRAPLPTSGERGWGEGENAVGACSGCFCTVTHLPPGRYNLTVDAAGQFPTW
jgi:hypothetical protein